MASTWTAGALGAVDRPCLCTGDRLGALMCGRSCLTSLQNRGCGSPRRTCRTVTVSRLRAIVDVRISLFLGYAYATDASLAVLNSSSAVGVRHHPVAPPTAAGVPGRAVVVSQVQIPCRTITCRLQTNQKSCHETFLREITSHMNDADLSKRAHERYEKHLGAPTNVVRGARTNRAALDDAAL